MTTRFSTTPLTESPAPRTPTTGSDVSPDRGFAVVGKDLPVKDAVEKVTGALKYAVDFGVPGMAYGKILRAPTRTPASCA